MDKKGNIIFLYKDGLVDEYNIYSSMQVIHNQDEIKKIIKEKKYNIYFTNYTKDNIVSIKNVFFFKANIDNLERVFLGNFFFFTKENLNLENCTHVHINKT